MLKIAIVLILAAFDIISAEVKVTVVGPSKPLDGVATKYTCEVENGDAKADGYTWSIHETDIGTIDVSVNTKEQKLTIANSKTGLIECSATVGGKKHNGVLTVESATTPATPTITQNEGFSGVFQKGGALTCSSLSYTAGSVTDTTTWSWYKGSELISDAVSETYTISAATNKGSYTCKISIGTKTSEPSAAYQVKVIDSITPTIKQTGGVSKTFQKGGDYTLTCASEAYTASSGVAKPKWSWEKGGEKIETANSNEFKVSNAKASDAGDYVCSITMADVKGKDDISKSAKFTVVVSTELGVHCENGDTCATLASALYTGKCDNERCVCKAGAKPIPESCSGAASILASLSMTVAMVMMGHLL